MRQIAKINIVLALLLALGLSAWLLNNQVRAASTVTADGDTQYAAYAAGGTAVQIPTSVAPSPTTYTGIPLTPAPGSQAPGPRLMPTSPPSQGLVGIRPSNVNPDSGAPAVTEQDVRDQVMQVGDWQSTFPPNGPVTVSRVEFLTGDQVNARLNRPGSQPSTRLICFVTLTGNFQRTVHLAPQPGSTPSPVVSSSIYLLFDALTGNLIAKGEGTP